MDTVKAYMKKIGEPANLPRVVLAAGAAGLLLRLWLFSSRAAQTGLLRDGHIAAFLLWLLTAAVVGFVLWTGRISVKVAVKRVYGAAGCLLAGLSIGITSVAEWILYPDTLTMIASVLGLISAAALLFVANSRWTGRPRSVLYHGAVCVYLMLRLVSQYRHWSADPQLMDYCFELFASVCLMLATYQSAALDMGFGNRKLRRLFQLGGVYFCMLSLLSSENMIFYLGTGIWMFTGLCGFRKQGAK